MQQVMNNVHKIWFSTGVFDPEYPPSKILALVKLFEGVRPSFPLNPPIVTTLRLSRGLQCAASAAVSAIYLC